MLETLNSCWRALLESCSNTQANVRSHPLVCVPCRCRGVACSRASVQTLVQRRWMCGTLTRVLEIKLEVFGENFLGGVFLISRSVLPRPPRQRARAPCLENKNSAPQARFRSQTPSKQAKVHAFWLPKQQCNQPQPPQPPHWSTRPTGPVDHPADPPTHRAPHPHPTLALGLRTLGAPGPPQGPLFSVFVLPCSLTASDTPGRPLTERSKTLALDQQKYRT